MTALAACPPVAEIATPEPKSCRSCRRSQYHVTADTLRCTEPKAPPVGGVIFVGVAQVKTKEQQREYDAVCRTVASHCKFYQEQA